MFAKFESIIVSFFQIFQFIFAIFRFIFKINNFSDFFKWNREIRNCLKWTRLWKYIQTIHFAKNENNDLCCIAFRQIVNENFYHDIININIIKTIYDKIVNVCKFKNFNAFMIIYVKFNIFKTVNFDIINEYDIKFRNVINELIIYSFNFKMNENWLIYKYFENLNDTNNVRLFIKRWISEHEFFNNKNDIDFKFDLFDVIHIYKIQYVNLLTNVDKNVVLLIKIFVVIESRI